MALYLLEPKTCKYVLTVESPSLCELINGPIDEYGLFKKKSNTNDSVKKIDSEIKTKSEDNLAVSPEDIEKAVLSVQMEEETEENDENKKLFIIEL